MGNEGNQGDMARTLDRNAKGALVLGTDAGAAPRLDFCPVGNKPPDFVDVLVVDYLDVLDTEGTHPASRHKATSGAAAGAPAGTASRSASGAAAGRSGGAPSLWSIRRPVAGFGSHISSVPLRL